MFRILPVLLTQRQIEKMNDYFGWRFKRLFRFERHSLDKSGKLLYACYRRVR